MQQSLVVIVQGLLLKRAPRPYIQIHGISLSTVSFPTLFACKWKAFEAHDHLNAIVIGSIIAPYCFLSRRSKLIFVCGCLYSLWIRLHALQ